MKNQIIGSLFLLALAGCSADPSPYLQTDGGANNAAQRGETRRFDFQAAAPGALPTDFINVLGSWSVADGPDGRALTQHGEYESPDFPRIVLRDVAFTNVRVKVRCAMQGGETDRACGLMFRFRDSDNYYIVRANALEDNVRLYKVVGGERRQFGEKAMSVVSNVWHTLEATAEGQRIRILYDNQTIIDANDGELTTGKVGLWTKADSLTAFDDFEATEL